MRGRALSLGLLAAAGCIPLPYVVPPLRVDVASGGQATVLPGETIVHAPIDVEAGAFPLGLFEGAHDRAVDFGAGGYFTYDATGWRLGPYVEAGIVAFQRQWDQRIFRLVPALQVRAADDPNVARLGFGVAARLDVDYVTFEKAFSYSDTDAVGAGQGELGIGGFVELATTQIPHEPTYAVLVGLSFRLPASVGILFVPLP